MLQERRDQYKRVALAAKQNGDLSTAGKYVKIAKVREIFKCNYVYISLDKEWLINVLVKTSLEIFI